MHSYEFEIISNFYILFFLRLESLQFKDRVLDTERQT